MCLCDGMFASLHIIHSHLPKICRAYDTELNKLRLLFVLELLLPFNLFLYTLFCRNLNSVYDRAFYTV